MLEKITLSHSNFLNHLFSRVNLIIILFSIIVGLFFYLFFEFLGLFSVALSIVISLLTFFLCKEITSKEESSAFKQIQESKFIRKIPRLDVIFLIFYFCAIIITLGVSTIDDIYVNWLVIPFENWIRVISWLFLNFAPGYVVIKIISKKMSAIEKFVFSWLIGVFFYTIIGTFVYSNIWAIGDVQIFSIFNFLMIIFFMIFSLKTHNLPITTNEPSTFSWSSAYQYCILLCIIAIVLISSILELSGYLPPLHGDQWRYHGTMEMIRDRTPIFVTFKGIDQPVYSGPWLFYNYLASFVTLSGLPSINAMCFLIIFNIFPVISIYLLARSIFGAKKRAHL